MPTKVGRAQDLHALEMADAGPEAQAMSWTCRLFTELGKNVDLRQLRYFVQIVECGSFSRAAETLRIAQPSLSIQVKNLEEELGVDLLVRHARGVIPTELGIAFREHACIVLDNVERAKDAIRSQVLRPAGRIAVGLPTSACRGLTLHLIKEASNRYADISLHLVEAMTGHLDEWIQTGRLDVALLYNHRAFKDVAWTEMMTEELMLIVSARSELANAASVSFRDLTGLPLAMPGKPNVARTLINSLAGRSDVPLEITDCDSLTAIRQLVRTGYMTVMPHFGFDEEIERGEVVAVPILDPTPTWRLSVVVSERTVNRRASQAVAEVLADVIATLVSTGVWRAELNTGAASVCLAGAARSATP